MKLAVLVVAIMAMVSLNLVGSRAWATPETQPTVRADTTVAASDSSATERHKTKLPGHSVKARLWWFFGVMVGLMLLALAIGTAVQG